MTSRARWQLTAEWGEIICELRHWSRLHMDHQSIAHIFLFTGGYLRVTCGSGITNLPTYQRHTRANLAVTRVRSTFNNPTWIAKRELRLCRALGDSLRCPRYLDTPNLAFPGLNFELYGDNIKEPASESATESWMQKDSITSWICQKKRCIGR